ncbi:2-oxoacid:ferredoxin oxidoreductase subunit gamma [Thermodesulfobacterium sp. TA1]|uniref:2-oxoacid:acceptor oxidoreductase family protein n=1 Tax=Thermodesulfobacterium sp. TA1 TaxID=2234087 RepID=UPI001231C1A1|nr:2-oxoacid:acceptor oxidoreductase family protein [Thermodesulfobacterium sp. TA1]QER41791.1 2-oxoacid:ferredoxin oxidoreductase subunit gamma [Thermodesulfobacterium sp. TA1]
MRLELIVAGFGGQGVLFAGNLVAQAAMLADYHVTYLPVYGPEMRGGTCNCTVIISDSPIASPLVLNPSFSIILNLPSFLKFIPRLKNKGKAIINSDLVKPEEIDNLAILQQKYKLYFVPVNSLAESLGSPILANICALGAFYQISKVFSRENFKEAIKYMLGEGKAHLIEPNLKAFELGAKYIEEHYQNR